MSSFDSNNIPENYLVMLLNQNIIFPFDKNADSRIEFLCKIFERVLLVMEDKNDEVPNNMDDFRLLSIHENTVSPRMVILRPIFYYLVRKGFLLVKNFDACIFKLKQFGPLEMSTFNVFYRLRREQMVKCRVFSFLGEINEQDPIRLASKLYENISEYKKSEKHIRFVYFKPQVSKNQKYYLQLKKIHNYPDPQNLEEISYKILSKKILHKMKTDANFRKRSENHKNIPVCDEKMKELSVNDLRLKTLVDYIKNNSEKKIYVVCKRKILLNTINFFNKHIEDVDLLIYFDIIDNITIKAKTIIFFIDYRTNFKNLVPIYRKYDNSKEAFSIFNDIANEKQKALTTKAGAFIEKSQCHVMLIRILTNIKHLFDQHFLFFSNLVYSDAYSVKGLSFKCFMKLPEISDHALFKKQFISQNLPSKKEALHDISFTILKKMLEEKCISDNFVPNIHFFLFTDFYKIKLQSVYKFSFDLFQDFDQEFTANSKKIGNNPLDYYIDLLENGIVKSRPKYFTKVYNWIFLVLRKFIKINPDCFTKNKFKQKYKITFKRENTIIMKNRAIPRSFTEKKAFYLYSIKSDEYEIGLLCGASFRDIHVFEGTTYAFIGPKKLKSELFNRIALYNVIFFGMNYKKRGIPSDYNYYVVPLRNNKIDVQPFMGDLYTNQSYTENILFNPFNKTFLLFDEWIDKECYDFVFLNEILKENTKTVKDEGSFMENQKDESIEQENRNHEKITNQIEKFLAETKDKSNKIRDPLEELFRENKENSEKFNDRIKEIDVQNDITSDKTVLRQASLINKNKTAHEKNVCDIRGPKSDMEEEKVPFGKINWVKPGDHLNIITRYEQNNVRTNEKNKKDLDDCEEKKDLNVFEHFKTKYGIRLKYTDKNSDRLMCKVHFFSRKSNKSPKFHLLSELIRVTPFRRTISHLFDFFRNSFIYFEVLSLAYQAKKDLNLPVSVSLLSQCFMSKNDKYPNYERYEFLGDCILKYLVTKFLIICYNKTTGELVDAKARIIENSNLTRLGKEHSLESYFSNLLFQPPSFENLTCKNLQDFFQFSHSGHDPAMPLNQELSAEKTYADIIEAIIGSSYLENGMEKTEKVLFDLKIIQPDSCTLVDFSDFQTLASDDDKTHISTELGEEYPLRPSKLSFSFDKGEDFVQHPKSSSTFNNNRELTRPHLADSFLVQLESSRPEHTPHTNNFIPSNNNIISEGFCNHQVDLFAKLESESKESNSKRQQEHDIHLDQQESENRKGIWVEHRNPMEPHCNEALLDESELMDQDTEKNRRSESIYGRERPTNEIENERKNSLSEASKKLQHNHEGLDNPDFKEENGKKIKVLAQKPIEDQKESESKGVDHKRVDDKNLQNHFGFFNVNRYLRSYTEESYLFCNSFIREVSSYMGFMCIQDIKNVEEILSYDFTRKGFIEKAMLHPSSNNNIFGTRQYFEKLELIGDSILDVLVTDQIFPQHNCPFELHERRKNLVNNQIYGNVLFDSGLYKYTQTCFSREDITQNNQLNSFKKIYGDVFEAINGAILLDLHFDIEKYKTIWNRTIRKMLFDCYDTRMSKQHQ